MLVRQVVGKSMQPYLKQGQVVFAMKKKPRIGDVVIAKQNNREVIKRLTSICNEGLYLKGDNASASSDSRTYGRINESDILGIVIFKFTPKLFSLCHTQNTVT